MIQFVNMKPIAFIISLLLLLGCRKSDNSLQSFPNLEKYSKYEDFLSGVHKVTLYSTKSISHQPNDGPPPKELFQSYEVLGSIEITDKETISKLLKAVKGNIDDSKFDAYTMCFNPRHGMRLESHDTVKDFLICFECCHLYIFDDINSEDYNYIRIGLKRPNDNTYFNSLLDEQNIPREQVIEHK